MARSTPMDILLLFQTIFYCSLTILEIFVIASLQTTVADLNSNCLLFADFNLTNGESNITIKSDSNSCDFIIYTSVVEVVFVILLSIYHIFMLHKSKQLPEIGEALVVKPFLVLAFICSIFGFILGGVLSTGYIYTSRGISSLDLLTDPNTWAEPINPEHVLLDMEIAQASLWMSCALWIATLAATIIRYFKQRKIISAKRHAAVLLEHSRTNSDEILYETKTSYRS